MRLRNTAACVMCLCLFLLFGVDRTVCPAQEAEMYKGQRIAVLTY